MARIKMDKGSLKVPSNPTILYIEGDGVGKEITAEMIRVTNAAVAKAYNSKKRIEWQELLAGEKAFKEVGTSLPEKTVKCIQDNLIAIKGPLMTPVGKGARSLNVTLRQQLDLYVCLRPVKYFNGVPSPVRHNKIRFPETSAIGIKPVSPEGSKRLIKAAIDYAIKNERKSVTLVHKGNIMKFTEGGFREWGYQLAKEKYKAFIEDGRTFIPLKNGNRIEIKDVICDAFLQNILLKPEDYDVIATLNLNGDYVSDALAAEVGGIGISPGANINYETGCAVFEATHGTAPDIAGKNIANPLSLILSAEMMLTYIGWTAAANILREAVEKAIATKRVTKDFYDLIVKEGHRAKALGTKEFTDQIISFI